MVDCRIGWGISNCDQLCYMRAGMSTWEFDQMSWLNREALLMYCCNSFSAFFTRGWFACL